MKNRVVVCLLLIFLFPLLSQGQGRQNCQFNIEGVLEQPSCQGGMDGAIRLQVSGGAAPYSYRWNTGQETQNISQLTAGTYRITVQDREGCITTAAFSLKSQVKDLGLDVKQQAGTSGGTILYVRFPGNTKPFAMTIKKLSGGFYGPQTPYTGQALESGAYLLEAFTANGCSVFERIKIEAN